MEYVLGLSLVGVGLLLLLIEAFNPGFFVAVPGTVALILGIIALFFPEFYQYPLAWLGVIVLSGVCTWVTVRAYHRWAPPGKSTTTFTVDNIVGQLGTAASAIDSTHGEARIHGEAWHARSQSRIAEGVRVRVVSTTDNFTVNVEPAEGS